MLNWETIPFQHMKQQIKSCFMSNVASSHDFLKNLPIVTQNIIKKIL